MEFHSSAVVFLLMLIYSSALEIPNRDVTYEELEKLDASCNSLDNCKFPRDIDMLSRYTCHCGSFCSHLDTCCIDSPYRDKTPTRSSPSCRSVFGADSSHYFMGDECPMNSNTDSVWANLCEDVDGEDLMSLVPVTSFSTNLTYKNYFCFRCNENGYKYRYWSIKMLSGSISNETHQNNVVLAFNRFNHTWMAPVGRNGTTIPVTIAVEIPDDIYELPKVCVPNVISNCSDEWRDDVIAHKCSIYTSIIYFSKNKQTVSYKNPHCATCNNEDLENMICALQISARAPAKKPFSFSYLLDINRSDGNNVGEIEKCDENSVWDPFFKKCRVLKCVVPGHVVQDGKCVPP